jgi:hypothetical protein
MKVSSEKVKVDQLADRIIQAYRDYVDPVIEAIPDVVEQTAQECMAEIRAKSPRGRTGEYAKGWKIVKDNGAYRAKRIIWNKDHYRLVHLLEKGHVKVNGGRVPAYPHVGPAEQKYSKLLVERIEGVVRRGGK